MLRVCTRAMPMALLAALMVVLGSTPLCAGQHVLAPPLVYPPAAPSWTPAAKIPAERTAYVAIHFEDYSSSQTSGLDSENSLEGIRVMMHSVADPLRGNSKRDRVVLVPPHTSASSRQIFKDDGLIVIDMDNTLPHKDICAPNFDRIYLFSNALAERYDRVVYFDWDVVVQRPTDELFLCGNFCMVFNSILHFVDGVMVVKPDPSVFESMKEKYKRDRLSIEWSGLRGAAKAAAASGAATSTWRSPSKTMCWEKSYIFFLYWFGNIEAAELFNPAYGQSPLTLQRMPASVQLNAMMWYEKYSWTLMRGKEYRNMSNPQEVPALTLGYTTLKPFHWAPSLFFNLGWDWHDLRDQYLGTSHVWFIVSRGLLWIGLALFSVKGLPALMQSMYKQRPAPPSGVRGYPLRILSFIRSAHMQVLGPTGGFSRSIDGDAQYHTPSIVSLTGYWLPQYGVDTLGVVIGGFQFFFLAWAMSTQTVLIPQLTAPHPAWRFWFAFHTLGVWAFNHWMHLAYFACPQLQASREAAGAEARPLTSTAGSSSPDGGVSGARVPTSSVRFPLSAGAWLAFWEALQYVMMRRTFYPEFVVKMLVLFPILAAMVISAININRSVWTSISVAQKNIHTGTAAAHGGLSPILPGGGARR